MLLAVHSHPYSLQVLTFFFAVALPVALIVLVVGNAIYKEIRRHGGPPRAH